MLIVIVTIRVVKVDFTSLDDWLSMATKYPLRPSLHYNAFVYNRLQGHRTPARIQTRIECLVDNTT